VFSNANSDAAFLWKTTPSMTPHFVKQKLSLTQNFRKALTSIGPSPIFKNNANREQAFW
jgi:hypothetical protein